MHDTARDLTDLIAATPDARAIDPAG